MKTTKKLLSILLVLSVFFLLSLSVAAAPTQTVADTSNLSIEQLTTPNIQQIIAAYFSERTSFLQGATLDIPSAITAICNDEGKHKEELTTHQVALISSSFTINNITQWDNIAEVALTETAVYLFEDDPIQYTTPHTITIYCDNNGNIDISSDAYYDEAVDFYSCSYVRLPDGYTVSTTSSGSKLCILNVAAGEVGVQEGSDGYTKYGAWYGFPRDPWCAMFVSWCANQAHIPTSVIPKTAAVSTMRSHYASLGRLYLSQSQGGSYVPQAGDLFFQLGTSSDPGHVGIVVGVTGSNIRVYDGNWANKVNDRTIPLSQSDLVGFAKVNYTSSGHSCTYAFNSLKHWQVCANCNYSTSPVNHNFHASGSVYVCTTCGYQSEYILQGTSRPIEERNATLS